MINIRRFLAASLGVVFLVALLSGCQGKTAATVNGTGIPDSEVTDQLAKIKNQQPKAFAGKEGKKLEKSFRERILDSLINAELIRQEAERRGLKASDAEVKAKIDQVRKYFGGDNAKFLQALKDQGLTLESYQQKVHDQLISEKLVEKITSDVKVTDKEAEDEYSKNKSDFQDPAQLKVSHIVSKTEPDAKKVLAKLESGEDFAAVAKSDSIDVAAKDNGGDLGLMPENRFPPEALAALKKVSVGETTDIVKTQSGYEILKLEEKRDAKQKTYAEVKDELKKQIVARKKQAKFMAFLEDLKKKAKISKTKS